jgi:2-polyprenyl-6-methoxyphenol hydroxylase-like FAD-dependent oxidoreductase
MGDWKDREVIIVGGGIGGLAAALALARNGIASQIIEQATEFRKSAPASSSGRTCSGCSRCWD